jgi:hypothetical protein
MPTIGAHPHAPAVRLVRVPTTHMRVMIPVHLIHAAA